MWQEVYNEHGENIATIGIMQLVFDRLRRTCNENAVAEDFVLPESFDFRTLDKWISTKMKNKVSNE